jgi:hypothetical protein
MRAMRLPKEAFLALAALGWADGELDENEGIALLRAARSSGIEGDDLAQIEAATRENTSLGALPISRMTRGDRTLTYALAVWLVRLDGVVTPEEKTSLRDPGEHPGAPRRRSHPGLRRGLRGRLAAGGRPPRALRLQGRSRGACGPSWATSMASNPRSPVPVSVPRPPLLVLVDVVGAPVKAGSRK